jgi:hypothetical protein
MTGEPVGKAAFNAISSGTGELGNSPYRANLRIFGRAMGIKQLTHYKSGAAFRVGFERRLSADGKDSHTWITESTLGWTSTRRAFRSRSGMPQASW